MSKYCLLTPDTNEELIYKYYVPYLDLEKCHFLPLYFTQGKKKTAAKDIKQYIEETIIPFVKKNQCKYILVCDGEYFKYLTKKPKANPYLGYVISTDIGFVIYVPSYKGSLYDVSFGSKLDIAFNALSLHLDGSYSDPGKNIIKTQVYPSSPTEIATVLDSLHSTNKLTCDIETWSLKHYDSGIATITFCWNEHEGTAFSVDFSQNQRNEEIRSLLRSFFESYKGTLIFHNITYDMYILVYQLYMQDLLDIKGLLTGLEVLLRNFEDTKIISYLATNTCAGNNLSLKTLAQEFAGNYAQEEINNIDAIPKEELLRYNLIDGLSTWFVFNKYYPIMVKDNQEDIYKNIYKPAVKDIIQMQLTGLPMDMNRVLAAEKEMEAIKEDAFNRILGSNIIKSFMEDYKNKWVEYKNSIYKKKTVTVDDCNEVFNPNSNNMLKDVLYSYLKLPVLDQTPAKEPAVGKDILAKLINHTQNQEEKDLLQALVDYKDVIKILTAFIPTFKAAIPTDNGRSYIYGSQNATGTVSGRYSASKPNLSQLPSTGSKFAKLVKSCFSPPPGTLFVGVDFSSLEDRISALVTKDINKIKVYSDGYDGHCLRSYYYYKDQMPDITKEIEEHPENQVKIINSIKDRYKALRQASKAPTFACTYGGTYLTLKKNCGFTEEEAKRIEQAYHELYKESDAWTERLLEQAQRDGYITGALGLRVRTPTLGRSIQNLKVTPKEVEAEARTAANAAIQGYGMLTTRACIAFMEKVRNSPYRFRISVCNQIHDALYLLIEDDIDLILWVNENLIKEFQWQDYPAIMHPDVHLGGELSIFYPDWAHEISLPNHCTREQLLEIVDNQRSQ